MDMEWFKDHDNNFLGILQNVCLNEKLAKN
jgi:hypothetical protein